MGKVKSEQSERYGPGLMAGLVAACLVGAVVVLMLPDSMRSAAALWLFLGSLMAMAAYAFVPEIIYRVRECRTWYGKLGVGIGVSSVPIVLVMLAIWRDFDAPAWVRWAMELWSVGGFGA